MKKLVVSIIGNSPYNVLCKGILIFISFLATCMLCLNNEKFAQIIDSIDPVSVFLWCFGVVSIVVFTLFFYLLLLFCFEYFINDENANILHKLWIHLEQHGCLFFLLCLEIIGFIFLVVLIASMKLKFNWSYLVVIISTSVLGACMMIFTDYDDVELSSSQSMEKSIGALMAHGAYSAFYKPVLEDITKRMQEFEKEHGITLLVKKLVMICPLSCNANGSLEGKDGYIKSSGELRPLIIDEGANNNRTLKTIVYKLCVPSLLADVLLYKPIKLWPKESRFSLKILAVIRKKMCNKYVSELFHQKLWKHWRGQHHIPQKYIRNSESRTREMKKERAVRLHRVRVSMSKSRESYIAAEIPSPLSTLYEMRESMHDAILQYHRKCFIETLRDLLKGCQCIILEYDDLNSSEPLHSFLLSNLEDTKFVSVLK